MSAAGGVILVAVADTSPEHVASRKLCQKFLDDALELLILEAFAPKVSEQEFADSGRRMRREGRSQ